MPECCLFLCLSPCAVKSCYSLFLSNSLPSTSFSLFFVGAMLFFFRSRSHIAPVFSLTYPSPPIPPPSISPLSASFSPPLPSHYSPAQIHEAHMISVRALPSHQLNPKLIGSLNMRKALLDNFLTFPPIPHRVLRSDPRSAVTISRSNLFFQDYMFCVAHT